jgi:hypothetical protein
MLQIAPVISKPLPAVAVNEEGRRTQQGEQEQERATQRKESYPHPHSVFSRVPSPPVPAPKTLGVSR